MRRAATPIALVVLVALGCLVPFLGLSSYAMSVAVVALAYVVLAQGLNLIYGYAGWLSFGQVGFWGIGAYTAAILWSREGLNPWAGVAIGGVAAAIAAFVIGLPSLRRSRTAFIIVTLTFSLLVQLLATDWIGMTRGPLGIPGLPALTIGGKRFSGAHEFYWVMLVWTVAALALVYRLVRSRLGRTLLAIRSDEYLAQAQGIPVLRYKVAAFVLAAWLSGIAGGLYGFYLSVVDPTIFGFYFTQAMLVIVVVGGRGSFWGVTLAAIVLSVVPEMLRWANEWRLIVYGVVLVVVVLTMPGGFAGLVKDRKAARLRMLSTGTPALGGDEA
ncbi:MAG TPA: branched-chain amino acid ABC transporter permease [Gaiellaceae bacterium]|nr:branched-chain amino acid ABC transporter permease [Gaiellaceae bacterium]